MKKLKLSKVAFAAGFEKIAKPRWFHGAHLAIVGPRKANSKKSLTGLIKRRLK